MKAYDTYAAQAASEGAQIIVYPEYGLTGFSAYSKQSWYWGGYTETIPLLSEFEGRVVPCDSKASFPDAPSVVSLSCSARKYGIALVVNLMEYTIGGKMYNTNVALDTDGAYLGKYHKYNLFGETNVDQPPQAEVVSFTTSFGQTFGMIICADLIHYQPTMDLVRKGIKNFVLPVAWDMSMAQMQPLAYAQGWSLVNQVTLIISNHRTPYETGSGILVSGNPVSQVWRTTGKGKVHVGTVSVSSLAAMSDVPRPIDRLNLSIFSSNTNWKFGKVGLKLCSGTICCTTTVAPGFSSRGYVAAVLNGKDGEEGSYWDGHVCAVLPCSTPGPGCLTYQIPESGATLRNLTIEMTGSSADHKKEMVLPEVTVANNGGELLLNPGRGFTFTQSEGTSTVTVESEDVLTSVVLYGRKFNNADVVV